MQRKFIQKACYLPIFPNQLVILYSKAVKCDPNLQVYQTYLQFLMVESALANLAPWFYFPPLVK